MKRVLLLLFISSLSLVAMAQKDDPKPSPKNRFYAGIGVNGRRFIMVYNKPGLVIKYPDPFVALPYLHLGYQLTKSIQIEVSTAFSNRKDHWYRIDYVAPGKVIERHSYYQTKALIVPVKMKHTLFNIGKKRLIFYVTGSILPVYAATQIKQTEVESRQTTITLNREDSGFNTFASLGIGAGFKIWKRISGYYEVNILDRNLSTGESIYSNSRGKHLRQSQFHKVYNGFGINYHFPPAKRTSAKNS